MIDIKGPQIKSFQLLKLFIIQSTLLTFIIYSLTKNRINNIFQFHNVQVKIKTPNKGLESHSYKIELMVFLFLLSSFYIIPNVWCMISWLSPQGSYALNTLLYAVFILFISFFSFWLDIFFGKFFLVGWLLSDLAMCMFALGKVQLFNIA